MTRHLLIAVGLVVCSFLTLAAGLSAAAGGAVDSADVPGTASLGAHVVKADSALGPLQAAFAPSNDGPIANPFTMRRGEDHLTRLPFPPPPPLDLPALPVLPIPER